MGRWMLQWRYIRRGRWFKHRKSKLTSWVLREVSSLESFTVNSKVAKSSLALFWLNASLLTVVCFPFLGGVPEIGTTEHVS
ncbi:hypothetical protein HID58_038286 [Brassica napus]|uniref:Uncharacterized protein n=1 Tax=Brassica napus TaxID=3708 RepID=A0ABQ8BNU8_BRANA|nr:hypothetical protein HID58_038286 [Brassica napus]